MAEGSKRASQSVSGQLFNHASAQASPGARREFGARRGAKFKCNTSAPAAWSGRRAAEQCAQMARALAHLFISTQFERRWRAARMRRPAGQLDERASEMSHSWKIERARSASVIGGAKMSDYFLMLMID